MRVAGLTVAIILCTLVALGGCASIDGSEPYAMWQTYEHPDGLFHFRYLSPPWRLIHDPFAEGRPVLVIAPEEAFPDGESGYRYRLEAFAVESDDMDAVIADVKEEWQGLGYEFEEDADLTSAAGDHGGRSTGWDGASWLSIAVQAAGDRVAVMIINSVDDPNTADMALLLESLEPRRSRGH